MCKILTIINTKPENNEVIQKIINANAEGLKQEKSGFSVLRDDKPSYFMDEGYQDFDKNVEYKGEKVFCVHTRTMTSGALDETGLHLQRTAGWFWAHNGVVSSFSRVKDHSDSFHFFSALLSKQPIDRLNQPLSADLIQKTCSDLSFYGKGFLYNPKTEIVQWFCNQRSYIYVLDGCLIITTFELILTVTEESYSQVLGYFWMTNRTTTTIPTLFNTFFDDTLMTFVNFKLVQQIAINTRQYYQPPATKTYVNGKEIKNNLSRKERRQLAQIEKQMKEEQYGAGFIVDEYGDYLVRKDLND